MLKKGRESATLSEISRNTHEINTDLVNLGPAQAKRINKQGS